MPLVLRSESDILRVQPLVDYMVNLTDLSGQQNRGLNRVYKDLYPEMAKTYAKLCSDEKMKIGKLWVWQNRELNAKVINIATKNHWMDFADLDDIKTCLRKLADFLTDDPARRLNTLAMPMMGTGNSNEDISEVWPLMQDYLDGLDNVIHVCMRPDRFKVQPRYLAIIGDRRLTEAAGCLPLVEHHVAEALKGWGLTMADFRAIVSGGADGVDAIACGKNRGEDCIATRQHTALPIICKADWKRFGNFAGTMRNRTVIDIATHVIAIKTVKSKGTVRAIEVLEDWNATCTDPTKIKQLYAVTVPLPEEPVVDVPSAEIIPFPTQMPLAA